ncbi:dihydrodipicolinate synthase family protein [Streptomyces aquilus]|uniref:dihydrodipicolinate synthase family protein n=1 Tax=Streptomyces aquilus TaxID=2548456 RepID=UPI0036ABF34B
MTIPAPLTGVVPPVCTPLTPDGEVDVPSLLSLVDHLLAAGVHGLFVLGTSSEAAYLTDRQRELVVRAVTDHVGGRLPVLAGVIDMTTPRVREHVRAVTRAGADAVVATAPFYTRTHPTEITRHYRLLAASTDLPVIAYDLPSAVHTKLPTEVVLELASDGVLTGLKDSSGDLATFRDVLAGLRGHSELAGFSALTGSELFVDSALAAGAHGAVPGLANVDPEGYVRLYQLCNAEDWPAARTEQDRLCGLFGMVKVGDPDRMGGSSAALGAFKAALYLRGVITCPVTAEPQVGLSERELAEVREFLEGAGLL